MNRNAKEILLGFAAIICCGLVALGGLWCSTHSGASPCVNMRVVVQDSMLRQFVDASEIVNYLDSSGLHPKGKVLATVDCHVLEQKVLQHDRVRTACCYKTAFDEVCLELTQRVPVLVVVLTDSSSYYVDEDRKVMPYHEKVQVEVPVFRGLVSEADAKASYYDFALWLKENAYWDEKIDEIRVETPNHLVLTQVGDSAFIILGGINGYADKLERLHRFYTKVTEPLALPKYKGYDVRYDGQVVGIK